MIAIAALDLAARGAAIAVLLLLVIVLLRDGSAIPAARAAVAFSIGTAAYVVVSAPAFAPHGTTWGLPLLVLAIGNSAVFWRFARALFEDHAVAFLPWALAWIAMVCFGLVRLFWLQHVPGVGPVADGIFHFAVLCWVGDALRRTAAGWQADLVEPRRRLRAAIMLSIALYIVAIAIAELWFGAEQAPPALSLANAAGILAVAAAISVPLVSLRGEGVFAVVSTAETIKQGDRSQPALEAADADLMNKLRSLMEVERVYRQEGLTVAALASKLGTPEHRLRRLINQQLGYRNFNAFVNGYRLADAKAALADPSQAAVPVLTIAMDAGFGSVGPFNRAFKAEVGVTPTEFREAKGRK
jgi:AraC-like DNA-binding protein